MKKIKKLLPLLMAFTLLLPACSASKQMPEETGAVKLTYAVLGESAAGKARALVREFNKRHQDVKIQLQEYLDENGRSAKDRLIAEMLTGKVPDIIDLGDGKYDRDHLPYSVLAKKGYLEDLWPYIENDPELGRAGVMEAPLKAAEVDGGLYAVFSKVIIQTLIGPESLVGNRKGWSLAELQAAFSSMPEGSTVLQYHLSKKDIFQQLFSQSIESYVDRNTGACSFTSTAFKSALEFVNSFPDDFDIEAAGGRTAANEEAADRMLHGYQMLQIWWLATPMDV